MLGEGVGPAFLRVGGALVARHQVALALAAGCRRIIVVARGFSSEFAGLQHDAEQAGASFHLVPGSAGLSGLITAADEVLVLAEGLLPTPGDALPLLTGPPAVFVQPADEGVAAGFERIDLSLAWAGMMLAPGRLIDRLMDLAPDIDPVGALLRIALQTGISVRSIPEAARAGGRWLLIRTEADAQLAEERWMVRHTSGGPRTPGPMLTRFIVRNFGATMLHEGGSSAVGLGLALLLLILALAAGWAGQLTGAFLLTGVARVLLSTSTLLLTLRRDALGQTPGWFWAEALLNIGFDLVLMVLLVMALPALPGQALAERAFPTVMLIGLLWLLPRLLAGAWLPWLEDRLTLAAFLALLAAAGVLGPSVPGMSVALMVAGLAMSARQREANPPSITRA